MGLDWRPLNKPKQGLEDEFENLFYLIVGRQKQAISFFDRLKGGKLKTQEQLLKRFLEISIPSYETLNAPKVGFDKTATEFAESKFKDRVDRNLTFEQYMEAMQGYYILDLVPENDGIPKYIALHDERHVFRGQFLLDCEHIIGQEMLEEAYISKLSKETIDYGNRLMDKADKFAAKHDLLHLKDQRDPPEEFDETDPATNAHVLFSAAKWLLWWGKNGHGFEADF